MADITNPADTTEKHVRADDSGDTGDTPSGSTDTPDNSVFAQALRARADFTWERARSMSGPVARELAALEMTVHARERSRRYASALAVAVALAVGLTTQDLVYWGITLVVATIASVVWPRAQFSRHFGHAHALIATRDVPVGRLQVMCVAMVGTPYGKFGWNSFAGLLVNGQDELSCAALGRHVDGFCPHRRPATPAAGPETTDS